MEEVFRPSGRVVYHPMSELNEDGEIVSLLSGRRQRIDVRRRLVDATHLETSIPLTHRRSFGVEAGVDCIPPNDLPRLAPGHSCFVVIGGGKTGLDCVSWLLDQGAEPGSISWVISRDAWCSNRRSLQSAASLRAGSLEMLSRQSEVMATASSVAEYCEGMERCGAWLRVDAQTRPTMYHAATVTSAELDRLQGLGAENQQAWMGHEAVRSWLGSCRLDAVAAMMKAVPAEDVEACRSRDRLRELSASVVANMRRPRALTVE